MKRICYIVLAFILFASCGKSYNEDYAVGQDEKQIEEQKKEARLQKSLEEANKIINLKEKERIESFLERSGWQMENVSGIYFQMLKQGSGKDITADNTVTLSYRRSFLSGTEVREDRQGEKTFRAGKDTGVEFGLNIAVMRMKPGARARVIIPTEMGFVVNENGEKIKADATMIYEIEIKDVK